MKPKQRERLLLAGSKKREYPTKYDDYEDYDIWGTVFLQYPSYDRGWYDYERDMTKPIPSELSRQGNYSSGKKTKSLLKLKILCEEALIL